MSTFDFSTWRTQRTEAFESSLFSVFQHGPKNIRAAVQYPLHTGGKRIRPLFVYAAAEAFSKHNAQSALCSALSIELIHTYSLVHDDLPCMDNDDMRRGKPTVHKKFDEATALLVGDSLLTEAFAVLSRSPHLNKALPIIAKAAGIAGMIGGQSMDIGFEGPVQDIATLTALHKGKTGALIQASALLGGIAAGASEAECELLKIYGDAIGLAFQLADDLLDEEEDQEEDGPPSFVKLLGAQATKEQANHYYHQAIQVCDQFPHAEALKALANFTIHRKY